MINKYLEPYGFSINELGDDKAVVTSYQIQCFERDIDLTFNWLSTDSLESYLYSNVHKFISILLNNVVFTEDVYDYVSLQELVNKNYVVLPPEAKLDSILNYISSYTHYEGQTIKISGPDSDEAVEMYFANPAEWWFYFQSAESQGLIRTVITDEVVHDVFDETPIHEYGLTVGGISRLIKLNEGKESHQCFIAMAFVDDMYGILEESIKPALSQCGFKHYIVSDEHIESETTINDAILAGIKKARFTIADFTYHRNGVYFEAGYALGRGQKVIYTCRQDEMTNSHFDISHYQHIVWSDAADFKEKLINKIEAFIKD